MRALASAMSSFTDLTGREGWTTSTYADVTQTVMGAKSLTVSYGSFE